MKKTITSIILCAALLFRCGPAPLSGGTIDTGNAKIAGLIHTMGGGHAAYASVTVCPADYLPVCGEDSSAIKLHSVKETITDDSGYFRLDSLDEGVFLIEVNDNRSSALLLTVTVDSASVSIEDTLRPYAVVKGNAGSLSTDSIKRCALVYGLNRRIPVEDNGSFSMQDLPPGTFRLRIAAENNLAAPVDIDSVVARSQDTVIVPFAGWLFSARISLNTTASGADVARDVYGFPALLRLSKSNFHFDQATGSGSDCRFAKSDSTPLAFEIEEWDSAAGLAVVWVRIDTVFGNSTTQSFLMFWGNPRVAVASSNTSVFDTGNGFMCSYHFNGNLEDATPNGYDGVDNGTSNAEDCIIGRGRGFGGSPQYVSAGDLPDRPSGTISCWLRPKSAINSSNSTTQGIWGKKSSDSVDFNLSLKGTDFWAGAGGAGILISKLENADSGFYLAGTTASFSAEVWYHVSWTWGHGDNCIYINGALENSDPHNIPVSGDGIDEIGRSLYDSDNIIGGGPLYFNGTLDEFRIDNQSRSADWIKLCYMNQRQDDKLIRFEPR